MTYLDRRRLLALGAAALTLPPSIGRAWAIDAKVKTGTIEDVDHVVILMQENRSFDHYFGTMNGVRGFGDRFPIPLPGGRTVWSQNHTKAAPPVIAPFPLNTTQSFPHMRVEGTPHSWADAQYAWDNGRMTNWPDEKHPHAMGHYEQADIPFQWALANAFTLCDAYHCSTQTGTNTNRLFLWSGTNDSTGKFGGPSISNSHDTLPEKGGAKEPYTWTTYAERLEAAGVSWKIYEDMVDNFGDNPLVGFQSFRDSIATRPGSNPALAENGHSTQHLDVLRADVMSGALPKVSWIIAPSKDSEHPGPSSPAQGADYAARVLDCLTANADVWARTVFLINYDENDGFFDHAPPPSPPSRDASGKMHGGSTVDVTGEYHLVRNPIEKDADRDNLMGRPYGLGPRVPLFVVSPFARGGWVNSEVFDHTSVIRFLEKRFGVMEPNISPWRRAVCGDLTSCLDFTAPNAAIARLPGTAETAIRAGALPATTTPPTPGLPAAPSQASGLRRSRPLGYALNVDLVSESAPQLKFRNTGDLGAVFHVYDCLRLNQPPRRYTVTPHRDLEENLPQGPYDLFVLGPNGFHRRFSGGAEQGALSLRFRALGQKFSLAITNSAAAACNIVVTPNAYAGKLAPWSATIPAKGSANHIWEISATNGWYDLSMTSPAILGYLRRLAGRIDYGQPTTSDPEMGAAVMAWT